MRTPYVPRWTTTERDGIGWYLDNPPVCGIDQGPPREQPEPEPPTIDEIAKKFLNGGGV